MVGYLGKVLRALVLVLLKISEYVKTFTVKEGNKDKNNKLMSFHIDGEKLLEKFKTITPRLKNWKILN